MEQLPYFLIGLVHTLTVTTTTSISHSNSSTSEIVDTAQDLLDRRCLVLSAMGSREDKAPELLEYRLLVPSESKVVVRMEFLNRLVAGYLGPVALILLVLTRW